MKFSDYALKRNRGYYDICMYLFHLMCILHNLKLELLRTLKAIFRNVVKNPEILVKSIHISMLNQERGDIDITEQLHVKCFEKILLGFMLHDKKTSLYIIMKCDIVCFQLWQLS